MITGCVEKIASVLEATGFVVKASVALKTNGEEELLGKVIFPLTQPQELRTDRARSKMSNG